MLQVRMNTIDHAFEALLDLNGFEHAVGIEGLGYSVIFTAHRVPVDENKPHGLDYSFVLLGPKSERLAGFDNAHAIKGAKSKAFDHKHRFKTVRPYDYIDAATLIDDFYALVNSVLEELGAKE